MSWISIAAESWVYIWIAVLIVTIILEAASMQLTSIWFSFGALGAWVVAICGGPVWLQFVVFTVLSVLLLAFTRKAALKYLKPRIEKTNVDAVPGKMGIVVAPIRPEEGIGQIKVEGLVWSAKPEDGKQSFEVGERVEVVRIEGVKAVVRAI